MSLMLRAVQYHVLFNFFDITHIHTSVKEKIKFSMPACGNVIFHTAIGGMKASLYLIINTMIRHRGNTGIK